jgi:hypothetical protein
LADRFWFEGETLVVERGAERVRIRLVSRAPAQLNGAYVPAGPVLRALGAPVRYEPSLHRLVVSPLARTVVASPTPFNPALPAMTPHEVFTPMPAATPRPIWTGSPLPRRTALPLPPPQSSGASTTFPGTPLSTRK